MKYVARQLEQTADISCGKHSWKTRLGYVGLVAGVLIGGYLLVGITAYVLACSISEETEMEWFAWTDASLGEELGASDESGQRAKAILDRLVAGGELRPLDYRLLIQEVDEPNAFALPGGAVIVTRGLLEEVHSEAGLALVLGHELGHHQYRHCLVRLGRSLLLTIATSMLFGDSTSSAMEQTVGIAESGYSRSQETEADEFGLGLERKVMGTTEGCLEFFEKMRGHAEANRPRWQSFMASHPHLETRIEHLRRLAAEPEGER